MVESGGKRMDPEKIRELAADLEALAHGVEEWEARSRQDDPERKGGTDDETRKELARRAREVLERCESVLGALAEESQGEEAARESATEVRLMVVDDDESSRELLCTFLSRFGDVEVASRGPDAVSMVTGAIRSGRPFRLIFLDVMMPEMDGHEVLKQIRRVEEVYSVARPASVAMTSAKRDRETVLRARQYGSEAYFAKPLDREKLETWMRSQGVGDH
jgi:two-component system chemotaxis response regulator CheY